MFTIINIIIIIICRFHAKASWPWLLASMICLFVCLKSEWRPIFSCERSFSTLRVQVVLRRSFGHFHPAAVFLLPPEKLSDNHPLGEALATWPNKYNWFKWVMSSDKKKTLAWNRICWWKLQSFLNLVPFLQQCSKVLTEKNAFPTAKNILDFFFNVYCQI